ncbi:MAG: HAD family hydrolase, partial [Anaerolineae bacterium]|nr:HAD family hydrolase [Anaerolineae bacterium]
KVVFTADKISWDQPGNPPYLEAVLAGLEKSLDAGVLVYLTYMWERKDSLQVLHPWLAAAYTEISAIE